MKKQLLTDKKGSITEEIEKLKQRREERKNKNFEDKKNQDKKDDNNGKACDSHYENLMKKKKIAFNIEPDQVIIKTILNLKQNLLKYKKKFYMIFYIIQFNLG